MGEIRLQSLHSDDGSDGQGGPLDVVRIHLSGRELLVQSEEILSLSASKNLSVRSKEDLVTFKGTGTIQVEADGLLALTTTRAAVLPSQNHQLQQQQSSASLGVSIELRSLGNDVSLRSGSHWSVFSDSASSSGGGQSGGISIIQQQSPAVVVPAKDPQPQPLVDAAGFSIATQGEIHLKAQSKLEANLQGDLVFVAGEDWIVQANRGVSFVSSGSSEGIHLSAKGVSSKIVSSDSSSSNHRPSGGSGSGGVHLQSGGDLLLEDQSSNSSSAGPVFRGGQVSWSANQGDILVEAKSASLEAVKDSFLGTGSANSIDNNNDEDRVVLQTLGSSGVLSIQVDDRSGAGVVLEAGQTIWFGKDITPPEETSGGSNNNKVTFKGVGDSTRAGVEFHSQGDLSWVTDGPVSVRANRQLDIQHRSGASSGSILFQGKQSVSTQAMEKDISIRALSGKVVVQSEGGVVMEGKLSVWDHSGGLNSYKASSSMEWLSPQGSWTAKASHIREIVQGDYSISCTSSSSGDSSNEDDNNQSGTDGKIQAGGKLDLSFGKGLSLGPSDGVSGSGGGGSSGDGDGDVRFSTDGVAEFSVQGATQMKVLTDAKMILLEGQSQESTLLEFSPKSTGTIFKAGGVLEFQGKQGVACVVSSSEGILGLESDGDLRLSASGGQGDIAVLSLAKVLVEADSAVVSSGKLFSVISRGSSVVETSGLFSVSSTSGLGILTQTNAGGSIEIKSDSFTVLDQLSSSSAKSTSSARVSFQAHEGQIRCEGSEEIQVEASETRFVSEGRNAQISMQVEEAFSMSTNSVFASSGGPSLKSDCLLSSSKSTWSSVQDGLFSLLTSPAASQERAPIVFLGEDVDLSAEEQVSFVAFSGLNSGGLYDKQGLISVEASSVEFLFEEDVRLASENGPTRVESSGEVLFSSKDSILFNVHHQEGSGIRVESEELDLTKVSEQIEVMAGGKAVISTESGILGFEMDDVLSVKGVGPGNTIQVKTVYEGSELEIRARSLEWNSDLISLEAEGEFRIESFAAKFETASENRNSRIDVVANGVDPSGTESENLSGIGVGMNMDTSRMEASSQVVEVVAMGTVSLDLFALEVNVTNFVIESEGNAELNVKELRSENMSFLSLSKGVEVSAMEGESLDFQSEKVQIKAGMWGGFSDIKISSTLAAGGKEEETGNSFLADQNLMVSSDSNIRFSSKEKIAGLSETFLNFEAVKGDVLFRSITVDQIDESKQSAFGLLVEARESDGVVSFAPMQRMAHRQVC